MADNRAAPAFVHEVEEVTITEEKQPQPRKKGFRFWLIFLSLCISLFLAAFELTAVTTALPSIIHDLEGSHFIWVGSGYSIAATAFLPMSGGVAEIVGRRWSMISGLVIFALGSALCGSAKNMDWLIAARVIQGLGGSAILSLSSIIVSDMVPLRERGAYNGILGLMWALASGIGPIISGALVQGGHWRWIFYLNLPVCVVALLLTLVFLSLPTPPGTLKEKLSRMDWIGNAIIISSTSAAIIGLTWGGVQYPWSSSRVLVPLILGLCGVIVFFIYEVHVATHPLVPYTLLSNRTSISGYAQTFLNQLVVLAVAYYLPVYYQACKDASPIKSGIYMLGLSLTLGPSVIIAGLSVNKSKKYRPQLWLGWVLFALGMGVSVTLGYNTPLAHGIGIPVILGAAAGTILAVTYFPVLSPLDVRENARALAFFSFCRSFAGVWGISIGGVILQNELKRKLPGQFLAALPAGADFTFTVIPGIKDLPEPLRDQVKRAFAGSLKVVWEVMMGIVLLGLLVSLFMQHYHLTDKTDEKWSAKETLREPEGGPEV
ncbi:MFS general substrate transporter [Mycena sp. CBHHK59/15]|nr:MFS general substrate transporter [Mycena sp. CBHHK59/15]